MDRRSQDVVAGITVAAVLLPQSLAYAELAGLPAERGLAAAAVSATVGALAGSSPTLQTGPTALASLLTLGVLASRQPVGSDAFLAEAAVLAVLVGLVRLVAGRIRLGIVSFLLSRPVVAGLATGAGVLIVASQVPAILGVPAEASEPLRAALEVLGELDAAVWQALVVAGVTAAVMVATPSEPRWPSPLLGLLAGGVAASALGSEVAAIELAVPSVGAPLSAIDAGDVLGLLVPAVVLGFVGFAEVAAIARSAATAGRHPWSPDRELVGQGLACMGAGLVGGFPVSGSFSRSALAVSAGARTRLAGVVTGVTALVVLPAAGLLPPIPRPALAAVVAVAGVSLVELDALRELSRTARLQFTVALVTVAAVLIASPRVDVAVLVGVGAAAAVHLFREERLHVHTRLEEDGRRVVVSLHGVLFYLSVPRVEQALGDAIAATPDATELVLDLSGVGRLDVSGGLALADALGDVEAADFEVRIVGVPPPAERLVSRTLGTRWPVESVRHPPPS